MQKRARSTLPVQRDQKILDAKNGEALQGRLFAAWEGTVLSWEKNADFSHSDKEFENDSKKRENVEESAEESEEDDDEA